jgi:TolA-binding protein
VGRLTTGPDQPADSPALDALAALSRDAVKPPTEAEVEQGLSALRVHLSAFRMRRRAWRQAALAGTTLALLVGAGVWGIPILWKSRPQPALPLAVDRIEGGTLLDGGYLAESGHGGIQLFFNEGSSFVLTPGSRGRLREIAGDGARFSVEDGAAAFEITPNAARRWTIDAGPFLVTVKGTAFNVSWDPVNERFELMLRRGQVVVDGPVAGGRIPLRARQRLVIVLPRGETTISDDSVNDDVSPRAHASEPPSPAAGSKVKRPPAHQIVAVAAPVRAEGRRWAEFLAAGRWDRILAEADHDGIDETLRSASSGDLLALADAARYRRRVDLARAALLAHRRRFPDSVTTLDTLFLLGRVEESSADGGSRAIRFYDDYLARAPKGAYAAEALGRKMILTRDLGGPGKARPIANEYLLRFPGGSYAGAARALAHAAP